MKVIVGKTNWSVYAHRLLLSRFSVESNEYVPSFYKKQEVAWKLQKPNNDLKIETYVFRCLRVKEPLRNLQKHLKEGLPLAFLIHAYLLLFKDDLD